MAKYTITYFKTTGKYYTEAAYENAYVQDFEMGNHVRDLNKARMLPGLTTGQWEGPILVTGGKHDVPHLVLP